MQQTRHSKRSADKHLLVELGLRKACQAVCEDGQESLHRRSQVAGPERGALDDEDLRRRVRSPFTCRPVPRMHFALKPADCDRCKIGSFVRVRGTA